MTPGRSGWPARIPLVPSRAWACASTASKLFLRPGGVIKAGLAFTTIISGASCSCLCRLPCQPPPDRCLLLPRCTASSRATTTILEAFEYGPSSNHAQSARGCPERLHVIARAHGGYNHQNLRSSNDVWTRLCPSPTIRSPPRPQQKQVSESALVSRTCALVDPSGTTRWREWPCGSCLCWYSRSSDWQLG